MTTEEYDALVNKINEASEILNRLKYKKISEFPKLEELTEDDTLIIVDGSLSVVGRITAKELMAWFNDNLKNFICWRPIVENNTLKWVRDKLDVAPDDLNFADIIFPMASETENGMIDPSMYIIIQKLMSDYDTFATKDLLAEGLADKAEKNHTHDQYATNDSLDSLKQDIIDADYVENFYLEELVAAKGFIKIDDIPSVSEDEDGLMTSAMLLQLTKNTEAINALKTGKADKEHTHDQYLTEKQVSTIVDNAIPKKTSELENDSGYAKANEIEHPKASNTTAGIVKIPEDSAISVDGSDQSINLKPFSVRNMLANTDFSDYTTVNSSYEFSGWFKYPTDDAAMSITHGNGNGSLNSYAICHLFNGTGIGQRIKDTEILPKDVTVSFYAYASSAKNINVTLFGVTKTFTLTNSWSLYVCNFVNTADTAADIDDIFSITGADATADRVDVYITHIMCQKGLIPTGWCRYQMDILPIDILPKAGADAYGIIKPDGSTIYVDANGVAHASTSIDGKNIAVIDDTAVADPSATWSSLLIGTKIDTLASSIDEIDTTISEHDSYIQNIYEAISEIMNQLAYKAMSVKIVDGTLFLLGKPFELEDGTYEENILATAVVSLPAGAAGNIIKKSVIPTETTTEIAIPTEFSVTNNMVVYYNGILLEENLNYTIGDSKISAVEFSFAKDSVVTFVGSNVDESINLNTSADQVTLANGDSKFNGSNSVQSGMEYLAGQILALQGNKASQVVLTLSSSDWTDNSQSISVDEVTNDNVVIICPDLNSQDAYTECNVVCTSQGAGILTFGCDKTPDVDLSVNVIIL